MDTIDYKTRASAWRGLLIIIVILTLLANATLFHKIVRAGGGLISMFKGQGRIRFLTLVSLTIGDVLVALFFHTIQLCFIFDPLNMPVPCFVNYLSLIFSEYFMPFVYGVAICTLVAESIHFRRQVLVAETTTVLERPLSVIVLPWLLGLLIVLPMCLVATELDNCNYQDIQSESKAKAIVCVCQLLPVVFAFAFAIYERHKGFSGPDGNQRNQTISLTTMSTQSNFTVVPTAAQTQPTASLEDHPPPPYEEVVGQVNKPGSLDASCSALMRISAQSDHHLSHHQRQQNPASMYVAGTQSQVPGQQQSFNMMYAPDHGVNLQYTEPHRNQLPVPSNNDPTRLVSQNSAGNFLFIQERNALLAVAVGFAICIVPTAIFELTVVKNDINNYIFSLWATVLHDLFYSVFCLRTCVVPLIWIITGSIRRTDVN